MGIKTNYDAIVIGGGPNGLIAGAYLAKAGKNVLLLERRHETGGGLNTDEYSGFRLNLHAVYHMMSEVMPAYKDLDLKNLGLKYIYPDVVAAFPFRDGNSLIFTSDAAETARSIKDFNSEDANCFMKMWEDFQPILDDYLIPMTYSFPMPPLDQIVELNKKETGKRLAKISEYSFLRLIDKYGFKDPRVRMALESFVVMWGIDLDAPLGFLLPIYICRMMSAGLVKGGSHRLSSSIYRSFLRDGGTVLDQHEVTKIIMENGNAVGVEVANGNRFDSEVIISTLNPEQTFVDLIGQDNLPNELYESIESWQFEDRSLFGVHLGVKGKVTFDSSDPKVNEAMIVFCGIETEEELNEHIRNVNLGDRSEAGWMHVTIPTRFDATMAPPGYDLVRAEVVVNYDPSWKSDAIPFGEKCLDLLKRYTDLNIDNIVLSRYTTPVDIEQKLTTMKYGSIKHGAYTPLQMGYLRPNYMCSHSYTPIPGLFVGGASMYSGGMILGGPGYLAALAVGKHFGIDLKTES